MDRKRLLLLGVVGIVLAGSATAILVSFLSNSVTYTVTVGSPVTLELSSDGVTYSNATLALTAVGGSSVHAYDRTSSLANNPLPGHWLLTLSNPDGLNCSDALVDVTTTVNSTVTGPTDIASTCTVVNATAVTYRYNATTPLAAHYIGVNDWNLTFNPLAFGSYTALVVFNP